MSLMQRKPTNAKEDTIDDFIGSATTKISGAAISAETPDKSRTVTQHKRLPQTSTFPVNEAADVAELIGRGSVFAANFKRETFYVHKELVKAINKKAARGGKGEKTRIINRAIQMYLQAEGE